MNLQRIERLKGLLARVQLNTKSPRVAKVLTDTMVEGPILSTTSPVVAPPIKSASPVEAKAPVVPSPVERPRAFEIDLSAAPKVAPLAAPVEPAKKPITIAPPSAAPTSVGAVSAPVGLAESSLAPRRPKSEPPAVASWPSSESVRETPIEDVSAEDVGLEDVSFEDIAVEVPVAAEAGPVEATAPQRTAVQASPGPFTSPPSLEDLTFSVPPPPPVAPAAKPSQPPHEQAPASIDAALMAASEAQSDELEAPLLTPPPESGRQPARPAVAEAHRAGPTVEQLGEVLELEEPTGPALELAQVPPAKVTLEQPEELEYVPVASVRGGLVPRGAESRTQEATPASSQRVALGLEPVKPSEPTIPVSEADFEVEEPTATLALAPEISSRKAVTPSKPVIDVVAQVRAFRPQSFLELLDASIKLGR